MRRFIIHYFGCEDLYFKADGSFESYQNKKAKILIGKLKVFNQKKVVDFLNFNTLVDGLEALKPQRKNQIFVWDLKAFFSFIEDDIFEYHYPGIKFNELRNGDTGQVYGGTLDVKEKIYKKDKEGKCKGELKEYTFEFFDLSKLFPVRFSKLGEMFNISISSLDMARPRLSDDDVDEREMEAFNKQFQLLEQLLSFHLEHHKREKMRLTRSAVVFNDLKKYIKAEDIQKERYYSSAIFGTKDRPIFADNERILYETLRHAYYGGFNWIKDGLLNKVLGAGVDIDINSLYPYVMSNFNFPVQSSMRKLSKQRFKQLTNKDLISNKFFAVFHIMVRKKEMSLKKGAYPTLPKKSNFIQNKAIHDFEEANGGELYLSNYDFYHLLKNYDVKYEFIDGVYWNKMIVKPFAGFVNNLVNVKIKATANHQAGQRLLAKLSLNMCYGKFGQSPIFYEALPYFDENSGMTEFDSKLVDNGYMRNITIAIFITSIARHVLFENIDKVNANPHCQFIYSDTDSIHFLIDDEYQKLDTPTILNKLNVPFSSTKLGFFKEERRFQAAEFLRNKGYVEQLTDGSYDAVFSGVGDDGIKVIQNELKVKGWDYLKLGTLTPDFNNAREELLVPTKQVIRVRGGSLIQENLVSLKRNDINLKYDIL